MRLSEVVAHLQTIAPPAWAASWDNVGLLLGSPQVDEVTDVLVAVDLTASVLDEARGRGVQLIVAYHPPWFRAAKRLLGDAAGAPLLLAAARGGLALYSPHTAWDVAPGGANDVLAQAAGLASRDLRPLAPLSEPAAAQSERGLGLGQGRLGTLATAVAPAELARQLKKRLGAGAVQWSGGATGSPGLCRRVAVCAGAGSSLLGAAAAQGADTFVTGELGHHDALLAKTLGLVAICVGHAVSEAASMAPLAARIQTACPALAVQVSSTQACPWQWC